MMTLEECIEFEDVFDEITQIIKEGSGLVFVLNTVVK